MWITIALLAACSAAQPTPRPASYYIDEYGGSLAAIEAILDYTDCGVLADTFDAADSNREAFGPGSDRSNEQLGRMTAALDRMDALGCD